MKKEKTNQNQKDRTLVEKKERRQLRRMILQLNEEGHRADALDLYADYRDEKKFGKLRVMEDPANMVVKREKIPRKEKKIATLPMRLHGRAADRLTDALKKLEAANLEIESEIARLESRVHALCAEKDSVRNGIQNVIRIIKRLAGKGSKGNK